MKLYVRSPDTQAKIHLRIDAPTRQDLSRQIGASHFSIGKEVFSVEDVFAEKEMDGTAAGIALGGVLGLIGGVPGVIAGGVIGGLLGNSSDERENQKIELFNRSGEPGAKQ